ncbi:MAG: PrsW family glutamic-type intramembrane protease [Cyanobacteriota bacterium]|nr:PrsW family glutamic-type intramembrane protease [Cyanobacteriota bacterium]
MYYQDDAIPVAAMVNLAAHPSLWPVLAGVIALALAPLAFFLWFAYTRDKLNPEPRGLVLRVFLFGLLAFIPAFLCRQLIPLPYWLTGILLVPVVDELAKFAVVKTTVYHHREFDEPVDGIIFAAVAGLGFATLEVVGSMAQAYLRIAAVGVPDQAVGHSTWLSVLGLFALKGLLLAPGQALWSGLWGYTLGRAKFIPANQRPGLVGRGLLAAIFAHATFNALAMEPNWWLNRLGLVLVIALLWLVVRRCLSYALAIGDQLGKAQVG